MILKKIKLHTLVLLCLVLTFSSIGITAAQDPSKSTLEGLNKTATEGGVSTAKQENAALGLTALIGAAINYAFGAVAIIFVVIIMLGGYFWMGSSGNEESIKKAKTFILNGIFGLMVIFLSYALTAIILYSLSNSSGNV